MRINNATKPSGRPYRPRPPVPLSGQAPTNRSNQVLSSNIANLATVKKRLPEDSEEDQEDMREKKRKKTAKLLKRPISDVDDSTEEGHDQKRKRTALTGSASVSLSTAVIPSGHYSRRFDDLVIWNIKSRKDWNWQHIWNFVNTYWPENKVGCRRNYKNIFEYVTVWLAKHSSRQLEADNAWSEIQHLVNLEHPNKIPRPTTAAVSSKAKSKATIKPQPKGSRKGKERAVESLKSMESTESIKSGEEDNNHETETASSPDERSTSDDESIDSSISSLLNFRRPYGWKGIRRTEQSNEACNGLSSSPVGHALGDKSFRKYSPDLNGVRSKSNGYSAYRNPLGGKGPRKTVPVSEEAAKSSSEEDSEVTQDEDLDQGCKDHIYGTKCPKKLEKLREKMAEQQSDSSDSDDTHPSEGGKTTRALRWYGIYPGHPSEYLDQRSDTSDTEPEDNIRESLQNALLSLNEEIVEESTTRQITARGNAFELPDNGRMVWEIRQYFQQDAETESMEPKSQTQDNTGLSPEQARRLEEFIKSMGWQSCPPISTENAVITVTSAGEEETGSIDNVINVLF
jgi:hypothetical protein